MDLDLGGAILGALVQWGGAGAGQLVRGSEAERLLVEAIAAGIDSVLEEVDPDTQPKLRAGLQMCFSRPRRLELDPSLLPDQAFRSWIAERLSQLEDSVCADSGIPFYEWTGVSSTWLSDQIAASLLRAIQAFAIGRDPSELPQAVALEEIKASQEEIKTGQQMLLEVVSGQPPGPGSELRSWEGHLRDVHGKALRDSLDGARSPFNAFLEASDRTSHQNPDTRWSAFDVLEQIGAANPNLRQSVIDKICHHLRSPARPGPEELKLRLYLQNILGRRLTSWDENYERTEQRWEGIDLDLSGAELTDFTFMEGAIRRADFTETKFSGQTDFTETEFQSSVHFSRAKFAKYTSFTRCKFSIAGADFSGARFRNTCTFHQATLYGPVNFIDSHFIDEASFLGTIFEGPASFMRTKFKRGAGFEDALFEDAAYFYDTNFGPMGFFLGARFEGAVSFRGALPVASIDLHHALGDSSLAFQTWPDGWTNAFRDCLAVVREDEKKEVINRHGSGALCGDCRSMGVCRLDASSRPDSCP